MIIVILFTVSIFLLVSNFAFDKIKNPLAEGLNGSVSTQNDSDLINNALSQTGGGLAFFDGLIPFLLIGIFGFVMLSTGAVFRSPIMIFVGVIILGVLVTLAVVYSNVYGNLIDSELGDSGDNVTIASMFMQYLPVIVIIGIILLVIVIAFKPDGGSAL